MFQLKYKQTLERVLKVSFWFNPWVANTLVGAHRLLLSDLERHLWI